MEELKRLVLSLILNTDGIFGFWECQLSYSRKKIEFLIEESSRFIKLLIEAFMEEIIPTVMDKYDFQCRQMSLSNTIFAIFVLSRLGRK